MRVPANHHITIDTRVVVSRKVAGFLPIDMILHICYNMNELENLVACMHYSEKIPKAESAVPIASTKYTNKTKRLPCGRS